MTTQTSYLHVFLTGEKVTPESAERGDYAEAGYVDPKMVYARISGP
jgi:hypothetical protein